ncbi:hypothetical protein [Bradyrhizobium cytisi]|uniref:Uncharacterized protein n=1 Tax=Bradyrhizobium cytisi TaxID=515489 RepID=A0A5S4X0K9_9BRAD|nr:hypothetical protein [Bradyrhizobium cytisi]TYL85900.1 hypothetical protein FXB38_10275 [Bradyrhizobium cytisi]
MAAKSKAKAVAVDDVLLSYLVIGSGIVLVLIGLLGLVVLRRRDIKTEKQQELSPSVDLPQDPGL